MLAGFGPEFFTQASIWSLFITTSWHQLTKFPLPISTYCIGRHGGMGGRDTIQSSWWESLAIQSDLVNGSSTV
jgi:hypothetical protein